MASLDAFSPGSMVAGKLRIVRQVGEGGMGAVYEVEHELTRHRRALKLLHAGMARIPGVVERFLREASAAGRIGNAHIASSAPRARPAGGSAAPKHSPAAPAATLAAKQPGLPETRSSGVTKVHQAKRAARERIRE
ncbi:MAG TPA: hypothetical protein VER33_18495 [Polyangiaceae bacterium]|nr:hypothetical protein [Polyangiaceae bacterium]